MIGIDFETFWDSDYSLQHMGVREYIMDPRFQAIGVSIRYNSHSAPVWYHGEQILPALKRIWPHDKGGPAVLAHNARFDGGVLAWRYGIRPRLYFDSAATARATIKMRTKKGSVSLAACADFFGLPAKGTGAVDSKGKRYADFTPRELAAYGEYCCHDNWLAWQVFQRTRLGVSDEELLRIDSILRMYLEPILQLDKEVLQAALRQHRLLQADTARASGLSLTTLRSRKKFLQALYDAGGTVQSKISPTTGKATPALARTDQSFMDLLGHPSEQVRRIVKGRLAASSNIEITRTERLLHLANLFGDLAIPLIYYGAHTGRCAGDEKINMQNPPRESLIRSAIRAPDGHVVVKLDARQIEARMLAWFAGALLLLDWFRKGLDVYAKFATELFGYEVTEDDYPNERRVGKVGVLSAQYGTGAPRFEKMLRAAGVQDFGDGLEVLAQQTVYTYRDTMHQIPASWRAAQRVLQSMVCGGGLSGLSGANDGFNLPVTGTDILLPNDMRLMYPGLRDQDGELLYFNGKSDVRIYGPKTIENINQALANIVTWHHAAQLRPVKRAVLNEHDASIYVVPEDEAKDFIEYAKHEMRKPPEWCPSLPLDVSVGVGVTLGAAK